MVCSDESLVSGLVSIVVPVYCVEQYLDECISSILAQTYSKIELILIDDGSPDNSPAICDAWGANDSRIRVFHKDNGGLSSARNYGIERAKGEFLLFVDSDDVICADLIDKCLKRLERDSTDGCFFKHSLFSENLDDIYAYPESALFPDNGVCNGEELLSLICDQRVHNYAPMHLVKTCLYRKIGFHFPVGRKMEDMASTFRLCRPSARYSLINESLYLYRQRANSTVGSWCHGLSLDTFTALEEMLSYVEQVFPNLRSKTHNYAIKFGFYCWVNEPKRDECGLSLSQRQAFCSRKILQFVNEIGLGELTFKNLLKYFALRSRLLTLIYNLK